MEENNFKDKKEPKRKEMKIKMSKRLKKKNKSIFGSTPPDV